MKRMIVLSGLLLSVLSGCMSYDEARVGPFGSSVNQTLYQQIANKEVAADPGTEISPAGTDGPLTERVIDNYRGVTGDAKQVEQPVDMVIDRSSN